MHVDHISDNLVNTLYTFADIFHTMCTLAFDPSKVSSEVNLSELMMLRMCLAERLSLNPDDYEAEQQLREVELKVECVWCLEECTYYS